MSESSRLPARPSLEQLQKQAKELLREYRAGAGAEAKTLSDAQFEIAHKYGFESWAKLKHHLGSFAAKDITDATLERITRRDHITSLNLDGSTQLTDAGLACLARLPRLEELNLSGTRGQITDRGLEVLCHLPRLRRFQMCWQPNVSDAGVAHLADCESLESVDLMGTNTGDAAIAALAGKPSLRRFKTGRNVTDRGLALLIEYPAFKTWQGGDVYYDLMTADAAPTQLLIDGPFTNSGIRSLADLEGLFALTFFWHCSGFTSQGLDPLKQLPNLGFLGCDGKQCDDAAMRHIAGFPKLRKLMIQGTVATDIGFEALSHSPVIEYIWGRECPNLTSRGFTALGAMAALRGLAVSCKGVSDAALSALPDFPALRELMPMDVPDDAFRHIGRCQNLEGLWCMYCRDTGDAATGHIAALQHLKTYYAGQTRITDHSLKILGRMQSLEDISLWNCSGITNTGIAHLARLTRLRQLTLSSLAGLTRDAISSFAAEVRVNYTPSHANG